MKPDEFYRRLESLGFKDSGARSAEAPELRSYDPPERLRALLSSVNVGQLGKGLEGKCAVTLEAADGCEIRIIQGEPVRIKPEIGSAFGPILFPMDKALLQALALDANHLREWIDHYPIFSFAMKSADEPGEQITGVGTRCGLEPIRKVN